MPYLQRNEIETPPDDTIVWRYFKLHHFLRTLKSKSIYFAPICKYFEDDPWEAAIPKSGLEWRHKMLVEADKKGEAKLQKAFQEILKIEGWRVRYTKAVKANCWHISNSESEAMWKLYIGSNDGVAVKSTVGRIKSAISESEQQIFIGKIKYIDYEEAEFNDVQWFDFCFHKRQAFKHENEMRLAFVNSSDIMIKTTNPSSIEVPSEMDSLVNELYVSSTREDLRSEIVAALRESGLNKKVFITSLSLPPINGLSLFKFMKK